MTEEAKRGAHELLMAVFWVLVGVLIGGAVVEHYAPKYPTVFCRPSDNGCEPYPWKP